MSQLLEILAKNLNPTTIAEISQRIGASPDQTKGAIDQALPLLVGALSKSSGSASNGWTMLSGFLDKNHDGSILDDLVGMALGNANNQQNSSALQGLLGNNQGAVAQHVQKESGLGMGEISKLLPLLAPMVIGALGKVQRSQSMDQGSLTQFLEKESTSVRQQSPGSGSLLNTLLDKNGDGSIVDDVMRQGTAMLGKFLGGKS